MIEYLSQSNDLCSPKDYLAHYTRPIDIVLDGGKELKEKQIITNINICTIFSLLFIFNK